MTYYFDYLREREREQFSIVAYSRVLKKKRLVIASGIMNNAKLDEIIAESVCFLCF